MAKEKTEQQTEIKNNVKIKDAGPCKKKISIEIPPEAITAALDKQYKDLGKDAAVPGFRPGRAPRRLLEKRFGKEVAEQTKLQLLAEAADNAVKDNELDTLGEPDIDFENIDLPAEGAMKLEFEIEVRPQFDLPKLEEIPVKKPHLDITEEKIDEGIKGLQKRFGTWEPTDKPVKQDDMVIADVVLKPENEEEEKIENTDVFVRQTGFAAKVPVEGLDKILKGAKIGDEKKTTVDVPATFFNEKYRGKKIDITITIKQIKALKDAELNEEFFKNLGVENEKELREKFTENLEQQNEYQQKAAMRDDVYKYLLDKTKFDIPEDIAADQAEQLYRRQLSQLLMSGLPKEKIDEQIDALKSETLEDAKRQLKSFFIMDAVAKKLEIEATPEEINGHIAQAAFSRGIRPDKMREQMAKDGSITQFALEVREQKCIEKILESAKITEEKPKAAPAKKPAAKTAKTASEKKPPKPTAKKTAEKKTAKKTTKPKTDK